MFGFWNVVMIFWLERVNLPHLGIQIIYELWTWGLYTWFVKCSQTPRGSDYGSPQKANFRIIVSIFKTGHRSKVFAPVVELFGSSILISPSSFTSSALNTLRRFEIATFFCWESEFYCKWFTWRSLFQGHIPLTSGCQDIIIMLTGVGDYPRMNIWGMKACSHPECASDHNFWDDLGCDHPTLTGIYRGMFSLYDNIVEVLLIDFFSSRNTSRYAYVLCFCFLCSVDHVVWTG